MCVYAYVYRKEQYIKSVQKLLPMRIDVYTYALICVSRTVCDFCKLASLHYYLCIAIDVNIILHLVRLKMEADKEQIFHCFVLCISSIFVLFLPKEKCCWCTQNYLSDIVKIL